MRYAIVREEENTHYNSHNGYKFSKWHDTEEEAIEESKRLCSTTKENSKFIVLKEIGHAKHIETPIEFIIEKEK